MNEKESLYQVLDCLTEEEIRILLNRINEGKIVGELYWSEDCGCLIGTAAKIHTEYLDSAFFSGLPSDYFYGLLGLEKPANSLFSIEEFVFNVVSGDTPETSEVLKLVQEWIKEYLNAH